MPGCRVYHDADQSIVSSGFITSAYNQERWDDSAIHDSSTNNSRVTAPVDGFYIVLVNSYFDLNGAGNRQSAVRLNGSTAHPGNVEKAHATANAGAEIPVITIYKMSAGDYFESRHFQSSGGALNLKSIAQRSPELQLHGIAGL